MSAQLTADLTLDGYRLIRFLGRGGFGEVWLCRSQAMGDYRALKWIPATHSDRLGKEYESLLHYRKAAAGLRSPHLVAIEHVNRNDSGLYYVMPLADGDAANDPTDPEWQPLSLAAKIHARAGQPHWFSSREITALIQPILLGLQTLSDAGLVHRDVKPENILFFGGRPCLGDISLLGEDASVITRRGTPGYATPSWYVGGHPDMYGTAATLYTLLTGNSPDKMGRTAFMWPPQGENALSEIERTEWKRLHGVIRRATEEKVSERYVDFAAMVAALSNEVPAKPKLPRVLISALTVVGIAAATAVAAFRGKQAELNPPATGDAASPDSAPATSEPVPELTQEQRADYMALVGMIQGYLQDGNHANVLASVEELLSTYPQARTQPAYSIARATALKGLGRTDEAKAELRKDIHLSPQITPMTTRKDLWEELGDLAEAENDLTRILKKFGPNTFPLFLRADIRAKRGDFPGVHADRQAAIAIKPGDPEHRRLVETMWAPFETKFPGYAAYLKTLRDNGELETASGRGRNPASDPETLPQASPSVDTAASSSPAPASPTLPGIKRSLHDINKASHGFEDANLACNSLEWIIASQQGLMSKAGLEVFHDTLEKIRISIRDPHAPDYKAAVRFLDEGLKAIPTLKKQGNITLARLVLLQCDGGRSQVDNALRDPSFLVLGDDNLGYRVELLSRLGEHVLARQLLDNLVVSVTASRRERSQALMERARLRASFGNCSGAFSDAEISLELAGNDPADKSARTAEHDELQKDDANYAAFVKSQREK